MKSVDCKLTNDKIIYSCFKHISKKLLLVGMFFALLDQCVTKRFFSSVGSIRQDCMCARNVNAQHSAQSLFVKMHSVEPSKDIFSISPGQRFIASKYPS